MRPRRRFTLPIDPWPRASLGERMSIGLVLIALLPLVFCAAGLAVVVIASAILHACRSHDLGTALRSLIDRHASGRAASPGIAPPRAARRA